MEILLIEDDPQIAGALKTALSAHYKLSCAYDGASGLAAAGSGRYVVIILDVRLPDLDGAEVCRSLRAGGFRGPILILSGETKILTKIALLDMGADDYLTKPFSLGELKARLRVLIRRDCLTLSGHNLLTVGELTLDPVSHRVERGGRLIRLRRKEFALLECLMQHAGSTVTREMLGSYAWHKDELSWTNTIEVHIKHLRDQIDRPFGWPYIKTMHGIGYKLEPPPTVAAATASASNFKSLVSQN